MENAFPNILSNARCIAGVTLDDHFSTSAEVIISQIHTTGIQTVTTAIVSGAHLRLAAGGEFTRGGGAGVVKRSRIGVVEVGVGAGEAVTAGGV